MGGEDKKPKKVPQQSQESNPGAEHVMEPQPQYDAPYYKGSGKLHQKVAIITGGDSGIGRSICLLFAREGCNVCCVYHKNDKDAEETNKLVEKEGKKCLLVKGDVSDESFCKQIVQQTVSRFGKLDILVNHAGVQYYKESIAEISSEQLHTVFSTNVYSMFYLTKYALHHLKEGSSIINTTSVTAFKGKAQLLDYSTTKGAILSFTRSLALQLAPKGIRVNAVAPGPIWTPFIPGSFPEEQVEKFGSSTAMGRPGQPIEVSPSYVFLASEDASFITGQTIHPNGGTIVNV